MTRAWGVLVHSSLTMAPHGFESFPILYGAQSWPPHLHFATVGHKHRKSSRAPVRLPPSPPPPVQHPTRARQQHNHPSSVHKQRKQLSPGNSLTRTGYFLANNVCVWGGGVLFENCAQFRPVVTKLLPPLQS